MMNFENYTPENLKKYSPYIKKCPFNVNDISLGSFFMWHNGVNLKFALHGGSFVSMQDICLYEQILLVPGKDYMYQFPEMEDR